jgi:trk system potassium uptake protein TrkH
MIYLDWDDIKVALKDLSGILQVVSIVMLIPILTTIYYTKSSTFIGILVEALAFIIPSIILYLTYYLLKKYVKTQQDTRTKHAMLTVVFAWIIIALVGSLPFIIRDVLDPVDSFFESMSGWATTGMTMIEYPEFAPKDILFYRSLTHGVGGVGIIALGLIVLMQSGSAAMEYYSSEVGAQKIKPGIKSTVLETWKIYLLYTLAGIVLLYLVGMSPFDAINHALAAIATGGFSTHSESIGYYGSVWVEIVCVFLMLAGAISFLVHFKVFSGDIKAFFRNVETRYMFGLIICATVICFWGLYGSDITGVDTTSVFDTLRKSLFQVISSITCTGFGTANAGEWPELSQTVLMILMYTGGFYGSTAGGIKLLRLVVVIKAIHYTVKKMLLPKHAIVTLRIGDRNITQSEILYVLGLSMVYLMVAVIGSTVIMALGYTGYESISVSLSAMGNVGIVYIQGERWYQMHDIGKLTITLLMWVGRLEIFPILMLLAPIYRLRGGGLRRK